jgi:flagellar capping protein FliD
MGINDKNKAVNLDDKTLEGPGRAAVEKMSEEGLKIAVLGRVKDGKLEIDQKALQKMLKRFPDANMSFVAVNAPFDPVHNQLFTSRQK